MPRQIDHREQHVAQFVGKPALVRERQFGAEFADFLGDLVEYRFRRAPVKSHAGGPLLQLFGAGQGGERQGHAIEHTCRLILRGFFGALRRLDSLPVVVDRRDAAGKLLFEDMRVTPYHLGDDGFGNRIERKRADFFAHACVENHLEQEVAQLVLKRLHVLALDGIGDFIGFLDGIGRYGCEVLGEVPWAAALRIPQPRHHGEQAVYRPGRLKGGVIEHRTYF